MPVRRRASKRIVDIQHHTYEFSWNGRRKFVDAVDEAQARTIFMKRFGFDTAESDVEVLKLGEN